MYSVMLVGMSLMMLGPVRTIRIVFCRMTIVSVYLRV